MSEKRSSALLLFDIHQAIEKIVDFTGKISFDHLMADERAKDAILRNLHIEGFISDSDINKMKGLESVLLRF